MKLRAIASIIMLVSFAQAQERLVYGPEYVKQYVQSLVASCFKLKDQPADVQERVKKFVEGVMTNYMTVRQSSCDKDRVRDEVERNLARLVQQESDCLVRKYINKTYGARYELSPAQQDMLAALVTAAIDCEYKNCTTKGCFRYALLQDFLGNKLEYHVCQLIERALHKKLMQKAVDVLLS